MCHQPGLLQHLKACLPKSFLLIGFNKLLFVELTDVLLWHYQKAVWETLVQKS